MAKFHINSLFQSLWFLAITPSRGLQASEMSSLNPWGRDQTLRWETVWWASTKRQVATEVDSPQSLEDKAVFPSPSMFPLNKELCNSFAQTASDVALNICPLLIGSISLPR